VALDIQALKAERDRLRDGMRELEADQRKLEAAIKTLRQKEIQTKREIEALTTLIDLNDEREGPHEQLAKKVEPRGEVTKGEAK
jgi:predicted  nucleic acid-binding Zn-ribbon protein